MILLLVPYSVSTWWLPLSMTRFEMNLSFRVQRSNRTTVQVAPHTLQYQMHNLAHSHLKN